MCSKSSRANRISDEVGRLDGRDRFGEEHRVQPLQVRRRPSRRRGRRGSGKHQAASTAVVQNLGCYDLPVVLYTGFLIFAVSLQSMLLFYLIQSQLWYGSIE